MYALLTSTGVVAISEVGDKTQLLALLLASHFRNLYRPCSATSTERTWPLIKDAWSEQRNTMALAISSGSPTRPSGTVETRPASFSASPVKRSSIPVSVAPVLPH